MMVVCMFYVLGNAVLLISTGGASGRFRHGWHKLAMTVGMAGQDRRRPATRRDLLFDGSREEMLVQLHISNAKDLVEQWTNESTLIVALQEDHSEFWFVSLAEGRDASCNIPCEVTWDRTRDEEALVFAVMLDWLEDNPSHLELNVSKHQHVLGITWENNMNKRLSLSSWNLKQLPYTQDRLALGAVPYTLLSTYELDSHIPVLYPEYAAWADAFVPQDRQTLVAAARKREPRMFMAISNCKSVIVPNRLELAQDIEAAGYPLASFGRCLRSQHLLQNTRVASLDDVPRGSEQHLELMGSYLFAYVAENSYGVDYVSEKLFHALASGAVPVYLGAPNVAAFLPDPHAAILVSDFASVALLVAYLNRLTLDRDLLVDRHQRWRSQPLPPHTFALLNLTEAHAAASFACRICNCVRGHLGCPRGPPHRPHSRGDVYGS
jgi:hypothetical protein